MINFIGHASENLGLGNCLRQFAKAAIAQGEDVAIVDIDSGIGRSGFDLELKPYFRTQLSGEDGSINIWVVGAHQLTKAARAVCADADAHRALNVAFPWWELTAISPQWLTGVEAFDAILTGSEFVQNTFSNSIGSVPVLLAEHPLEMPDGVTAQRERFGIRKDAFVVYTGFDLLSDTERKNPAASVIAFKRAFREDADVQLVVKTSSSGAPEKFMAKMAALRELVGGDSRIKIVDERLAYFDLLCLYASCDVAMSLHRAEGLALMPLEMMRLGKPVVATGWSGNMTYMSHGSAGLVRYALVDNPASAGIYSPQESGVSARWADPDIDDAAAWLSAFAGDAGMRERYGANALNASLAYDEQARRLGFIAELRHIAARRRVRPSREYAELGAQVDTVQRLAERRRQLAAKSPFGRAVAGIRQTYDRHLGWRFGRAAGPVAGRR